MPALSSKFGTAALSKSGHFGTEMPKTINHRRIVRRTGIRNAATSRHRRPSIDQGLPHREATSCNRCFGQDLGTDPEAGSKPSRTRIANDKGSPIRHAAKRTNASPVVMSAFEGRPDSKWGRVWLPLLTLTRPKPTAEWPKRCGVCSLQPTP